MLKIDSGSVGKTTNIGKTIARHLKKGDIICLFGELGSGKTVLTKGIASGLGLSKDKIISPTFVLMRQYQKSKLPLYHFDLYRLKKPRDILGLGYQDYLYDEGVSVIEWADRLEYLLPKEFLKVELFVKSGENRLIRFIPYGKRAQDLLTKIDEDTRN